MADTRSASIESVPEPLTSREQEILVCLGEGLSNQEIASRLYLAEKTVRWYNTQIYSKLGVGNRREAIERARVLGLLGTPSDAPPAAGKHPLPAQATPFVGRRHELDEIAVLLNDPNTRLVTILAPGGMGKTRLALEAARMQIGRYADGVVFVPLAPLSSASDITTTIAENIGFNFYGENSPAQQLIDFLRERSLLLVLDNFEHLLSAADLLDVILGRAPGVDLLVTSREVLNLREEWLYPIQGMPFPEDATESNLENYGAVQLFVEHAQRVRRDFSLNADRIHVARLCQVVEGMPLALELAASWLKSLPCDAIVSEIEHNLDFLNTTLRNIPVRHRSMRTVFEQSWKLLTEEERQVFKRLSVFRGGFLREAAEQVGGASLLVLSALVDKSLIWREPNGRYQIHELLRQYAEEQLAQSGEEVQQVHDAHAAYYMEFLHQREPELHSERQRETIREMETELDNARAAWRRAVHNTNVIAIQMGAWAYYDISDIQGRYQEISDSFTQAIGRLDSIESSAQRDFTLSVLYHGAGHMCIRLGRFEEAQAAFHKSIALYQELDRRPLPGFGTEPLIGAGLLASTVGNYTEAVRLGEEGLKRIDLSDKLNLVFALYVLATATYSLGQFDDAFSYARRAYQVSDELSDH